MSAAQRRKGRNGEQELARVLRQQLGETVTRNLQQTATGGHDLIGVAGFAIECKRCERLALRAGWRQTCEQAAQANLTPCLAFRRSRQPWKFVLPLGVLLGDAMDYQATFMVELDGFAEIVQRQPEP